MKDIKGMHPSAIPVAESNYWLILEIMFNRSDQMVLPYPFLLPLSLTYDILVYTNLARVC